MMSLADGVSTAQVEYRAFVVARAFLYVLHDGAILRRAKRFGLEFQIEI